MCFYASLLGEGLIFFLCGQPSALCPARTVAVVGASTSANAHPISEGIIAKGGQRCRRAAATGRADTASVADRRAIATTDGRAATAIKVRALTAHQLIFLEPILTRVCFVRIPLGDYRTSTTFIDIIRNVESSFTVNQGC